MAEGFLSRFLTPQNQGLLSAGAALLRAGGPQTRQQGLLSNIGTALPAGLEAFNTAQTAQTRNDILRANIAQKQAQQEAQRAGQQRIQGFLEQFQQPVTGQEVAQDGLDPNTLARQALAFAADPTTRPFGTALSGFSENLQQQESQRLDRLRQSTTASATLFEKGFQPISDNQGNLVGATTPSGNTLNPREIELADNLSKRFDADKTTIRTNQILNSFSKITEVLINPSPAGDLATIFEFMKLLDPNSVVREGEFATASATGSASQRVQAVFNKIINGQRLTVKQREDFRNQVINLTRGQVRAQNRINTKFSKQSRRRGIQPSDIIPDFTKEFETISSRLQQAQTTAPSQEDLEFTARQRGLTVEQVKQQLRQRGVQVP